MPRRRDRFDKGIESCTQVQSHQGDCVLSRNRTPGFKFVLILLLMVRTFKIDVAQSRTEKGRGNDRNSRLHLRRAHNVVQSCPNGCSYRSVWCPWLRMCKRTSARSWSERHDCLQLKYCSNCSHTMKTRCKQNKASRNVLSSCGRRSIGRKIIVVLVSHCSFVQ